MPRSIAMFVHKIDRRAICQLVIELCRQMVDLGRRPLLLAAVAEEEVLRELGDLNVEVLGAPLDRTSVAIPQLARLLSRRRVDVLFAHHGGPARAAVAARLLSGASTRIVTVEHNHYSSYIAPEGGGRSLAFFRDRVTRLLYNRADCVAGVSPDIVEDLRRRFGHDGWTTAVLPAPGRSPQEIARLAVEPADHAWLDGSGERPAQVICCVGNLIPRKGQHILLESLPGVRAVAGDVGLMLVGRPDNAAYAHDLEKRAAALGVADRVTILGYRRNPIPFMARADVFALTSFNEGCPRVLSEAMACGVPVVAADCPSGPSFILQAGRAGLLVPPGDVAATAEALSRVLQSPSLRDDLIARGRERSAEFTPRSVAGLYLAVARELISRRPAAALMGRASPAPAARPELTLREIRL
jgi:glycosyltransferase involved in cell wall biosynthesis